MKCPKCGGAPQDMVLMSDPPQYRCRECDCIGTEVAWMTGLLRGDEGAKQAHAERLQAARDGADKATTWLFDVDFSDESIAAITRLIDAKLTLALLERGS